MDIFAKSSNFSSAIPENISAAWAAYDAAGDDESREDAERQVLSLMRVAGLKILASNGRLFMDTFALGSGERGALSLPLSAVS